MRESAVGKRGGEIVEGFETARHKGPTRCGQVISRNVDGEKIDRPREDVTEGVVSKRTSSGSDALEGERLRDWER